MEIKRHFCHCGKMYAQRRSLKRHQRTSDCGLSVNEYSDVLASGDIRKILSLLQQKDTVIQQRDATIQQKDIMIQQKDIMIQHMRADLKDKNKTISKLIDNSARPNIGTLNNDNSIHISTGQIKNILTQHSTGPPLEKITDMSQVFNEDDELFLEDIAYDYRHKILHKTLGDSLVTIYKTADPKNQAVWNTDSSRLNYLIKHAVGRKKAGWMMDKKGVQVVANIIAPVLDYLRVKMNGYTPNMEIPKTFETKGVLLAITKEINDGTLAERINKYIANHFYMTEHNRMLITHEEG